MCRSFQCVRLRWKLVAASIIFHANFSSLVTKWKSFYLSLWPHLCKATKMMQRMQKRFAKWPVVGICVLLGPKVLPNRTFNVFTGCVNVLLVTNCSDIWNKKHSRWIRYCLFTGTQSSWRGDQRSSQQELSAWRVIIWWSCPSSGFVQRAFRAG